MSARRAGLATLLLALSFLGACGEPEAEGDDLVTGLAVPWGLDFLPGGDALVGERDTARILLVPEEGGAPTGVGTVPGVDAEGEGGLLGLAVSPTYDKDSWVYAYFTAESDNRIVRFHLGSDATSEPVSDLEVVLSGIKKAGIHNGGELAFGPDGMLYAGTGDAGNGDDAQNPDSLNGKVLRMTPTGEPAPDNPFGDSVVYSYGHRNVQGLAWDQDDRLWGVEFGQNEFDEVNLIEPGNNYGWPIVEGEGDTDDGRFTNPQVTWETSEASPSGAAIRTLEGEDTMYVAALRGERLWAVPLDGDEAGEPEALLEDQYGRLRNVAVADDGSLWVTTSNRDGRGDPDDDDDRILRFLP